MSTEEMKSLCGQSDLPSEETESSSTVRIPCFLVLASDGLYDKMSNEDVTDMVVDVLMSSSAQGNPMSFQEAAEALTLESYVRASQDNIGVAVIAL
jgi:serine/threonine protein phosphatase PrpC